MVELNDLMYAADPWGLTGGRTRFDGVARALLENATTADKIALVNCVNQAYKRGSVGTPDQLITGLEGHVTAENNVYGLPAGGEITLANKGDVIAALKKYNLRQTMLTPDLHSTTFQGAFLSDDEAKENILSRLLI